MKFVHVDDLQPGDVLDRPVFAKNGLIMLEAGTELTGHYIERLRRLGFDKVALGQRAAVVELQAAASKTKERPSLTLRDTADIELLKSNPSEVQKTRDLVTRFVEAESTFTTIALPLDELGRYRRSYRERLLEAISIPAVMEELSVLRQTDKLLFAHSLQVSLLSGIVGTISGFEPDRMRELTLASLLFDIGMTRLPEGLIKTKRKLNDDERKLVRQHVTLGYQVLSRMKGVPESVAKCALLHHERYRGDGYPYGMKEEAIPDMAQIIGLSDVYDALISPRHHREPYPTFEAMEYLFAAGNYEFGAEIIRIFLNHISIFPVSSAVLLSTGQFGVVRHINGTLAHRPVVRIVRESDGREPKVPYEIDLSKDRMVIITRSIPDTPITG